SRKRPRDRTGSIAARVVSRPIVVTGLFSRSSPNIAHRAAYAQTLARQQHRQSVALFFGSSPFAAPRAAVAVLVLVAPGLLAARVGRSSATLTCPSGNARRRFEA